MKVLMENKTTEENTQPLVHSFDKSNINSKYSPKLIGLFIAVVIIGILSGYIFSSNGTGQGSSKTGSILNLSNSPKGTVVGSNDTSTFKDTAEGSLKTGGIDGEGAFHLERAGGESQNVYLTSSTVDLSKFVGKKIKVWGQTQKAQHAGWLMDVGRVEVL